MRLRRLSTIVLIIAILLPISGLVTQVSRAQSQLPDLTILDVWHSGSQIGYTLKNIGNAASQTSFSNALFIDGKLAVQDQVISPPAP